MTHRVTLLGADGERVEFAVEPRQSLVKAAARAGYLVVTGCMQGRCAICRARVLSGKLVSLRAPSPYMVDSASRDDEGVVRLCSVGADSDVELAPFSRWRRALPR